MANEQKINEFISFEAWDAEAKRLEGKVVDLVSKLQKETSGKINFTGDAKTITEATKQVDELGRSQQKLATIQTDLGKATYQQIQHNKELTKVQQLSAQATNEQAGAYSRLMAETQLANKAARDMAAQYGVNSKQFQDAAKTANEYNTKLKDIDAQMNMHFKNVGNYGGAVTSLRQEIKNLTQTLAGMEMQGKNNSKEYKTMVMRLGELKDAVGDVQARSKFFADDARYLNTVTQAVQGVVGAYSVWVGASELLGTKNEELEKIMRKMMALMTIMQGLSQVQKMLDKDSYVRVAAGLLLDKAKVWWKSLTTKAITAETVVTEINTAATVANTTALEGQAVAAKATTSGFGLIAAAAVAAIAFLGALAYSMVKFNDNQKKAKEDTDEWKRANDELNTSLLNTQTRLNKSITVIADYIARLRNKGKTQTDLNKEMLNTAKLEGENLAVAYENRAKEKQMQADNLKAQIAAINARKVYSKENEGLTLNEIGELNRLENAYYNKIQAVKQDNEAAKATRNLTEKQIKVASDLIATEEAAAAQREKENKETKKGTEEKIKYVNNIDRMTKILPKEIDLTYKYYTELSNLNKQLQGGIITQHEYNIEFDKLNGIYVEAIDKTELMAEAQKELNKISELNTEKLNKYYEKVPELASQGLGILQSYSDVLSANNDVELKEFENVQDEKLRILNERLRLGLVSETQYIADKSDLELEYDKKKEDLQRKEFKRKKALAIAEAVINAAAGVIKALGEGSVFGIIQAGIIAAMAGLEIAKISAQYPGFEKGRKDGPGTFAEVGEGGWEFSGDGTNIFKTPNSTTLTYLKPHQWVMPHSESVQLEKILGTPTVNQITTQKPQQQDKELIRAIDRLAKKPTAIVNMDANGIRAALAQGNSTMNFVNNHILFKN